MRVRFEDSAVPCCVTVRLRRSQGGLDLPVRAKGPNSAGTEGGGRRNLNVPAAGIDIDIARDEAGPRA